MESDNTDLTKLPPQTSRTSFLPWITPQSRTTAMAVPNSSENSAIEPSLLPGEIVMRILFLNFTQQAEKKIEFVMLETQEKSITKLLQRGENPVFDQLLSALGSVAEHCLPSLLRALIAWHTRQISDSEIRKIDGAAKYSQDLECQMQRREAAVEFIFCLALLEVLKQLPFHPGNDEILQRIELLAFRHFKFRESSNSPNVHIIADLYAEVIGALAQSRFQCVSAFLLSSNSNTDWCFGFV